MPSDFVRPKIDRIPLSRNRFIDIKRRLNAGESRRVFSRMVSKFEHGEKPQLDTQMVGLTKLVEYLVGWSFSDDEGKPVDVSEDAINNLDPDLYEEVLEAINAHEKQIEKEVEQEKNALAGESGSSTISSSPDHLAGGMSGSVN